MKAAAPKANMEPFIYGNITLNISQLHDQTTLNKVHKASMAIDKAKKELDRQNKKELGKAIYDGKEEIKSVLAVGLADLTSQPSQGF